MNSGYICIAQNSESVDYLKMAYLQALSCKLTQKKNSNFSVIVDKSTFDLISEKHQKIFDKIIVLQNDLAISSKIKQQNEAQIFSLSPYKHTIKTEADMMFTSDYSYLWQIYSQYVMNFTQTVYTYDHKIITNRSQRQIFDNTFLPNIYSAWTYFSYDLKSKNFYNTVRHIMDDWDWYRDNYLINCRYETPRTDEVYAIAARINNEKLYSINFGFLHMKSSLQNLHGNDWTKQLYIELQSDMSPVIGFYKQFRPLHYYVKDFVTDELLDRYEYEYKKQFLG